MRAGPDTAVIVLTYGDFRGLERTLSSVSGQTCPVDMILVSDDASGEDFPHALRERFPDVRFRANGRNLGTVAHMNEAAREAQSGYIKFLAAGDAFSDPKALEALIAFAEGTDGPAVSSQAAICTESLERRLYKFPGRRIKRLNGSGEHMFRMLSLANLVSAPGTLFRRSFFTQLGGFDESYRLLEDWPAWLRLTREGYPIPVLDRVTCLHAAGGVSSANLDAYHAPRLRQDMLLCYEKEILPYIKCFSSREISRIRYGYDLVRGLSHKELTKRYGWLERKTAWKRSVKRWLLRW